MNIAHAGLTDAQIQQADSGSCDFAAKGRGDCSHAIGLPGKYIPGQHDGPDDTVDHYGKPNGWCWQCWKSHQIQQQQTAITNALRKLRWATPRLRNGPCYQAINILRQQLGYPLMLPGGHAMEGIEESVPKSLEAKVPPADSDRHEALCWALDMLEPHMKRTLKPDDPDWNELARARDLAAV